MSKRYAGVDPLAIIGKLQGKGVRFLKNAAILNKVDESEKLSSLIIEVPSRSLGIKLWGAVDYLVGVHHMNLERNQPPKNESSRERMNLGIQVAKVMMAKKITVEQD